MSAKRARNSLDEVAGNPRKKIKDAPGTTAPAETFTPLTHPRPEHLGVPRVPQGTELSPLAIFSLYWDDEILKQIVVATNLCAEFKRRRTSAPRRVWKPLTIVELKWFLGATIFMGVVKAPQRVDYWDRRGSVTLPNKSLSLVRYEQIKRFLHISMPPTDELNAPADELGAQADELNAQADELNAQADELGAQADELNAQADELGAQADELDESADELDTPADELYAPADELDESADELNTPADELDAPAGKASWTEEIEPLSSHLRQRSKELYLPGTHVATEEMMVLFKGRSVHTCRLPNKPIRVGYKVLAICDAGYTLDWLYSSRTQSIAGLEQPIPELTSTGSAIFQLCRSLEAPGDHRYIVYVDKAFTTVPLLRLLRSHEIGACGTSRLHSAELPVEMKSDLKKAQNSLDGLVVKPHEHGSTDDVLCIRWEDGKNVRFLTTVHPWNEVTLKLRRRPLATSTNAAAIHRVFGDSERKMLNIPTVVDDYIFNRMNGADLAYQRRAAHTTHQRSLQSWFSLFFFLLDISLVNSHILMQLACKEASLQAIEAGCNPANAPFRRTMDAARFRSELAGALMSIPSEPVEAPTRIPKPRKPEPKRVRLRCRSRKTDRIVFSKSRDLVWEHAKAAAYSGGTRNHKLVKMEKKRACVVCRYGFKKTKTGRQTPKMALFECTSCKPPMALCAPEGGECWVKWHDGCEVVGEGALAAAESGEVVEGGALAAAEPSEVVGEGALAAANPAVG